MASTRSFLILFAAALLVLVAAGVSLAVTVHRAGTFVVEVAPAEGCGGDRVSLRLPGALVATAAFLIPDRALHHAAADLDRWGPVAQEALRSLSRAPDFVLVRVDGPGERVRIAKEKRCLVLDVEDGRESVHVIVPFAAANALLQRLTRA